MSRILLVQEAHAAAPALLDELHRAGHEVEPVEDGAVALHRMLTSPPELTLLGIDLPLIDGLRILETARNNGDQPIILLTARRQEADLLRGFELGADDYVCTPYSPREVAARIRTVLRRRAQQLRAANRAVPIAIGNPPGTIVLEGQALPLTRREFLLLRALSREPGRVCSRSELLEAAFPYALDTNERTVDVHIKNLRKKLTVVSPAHRWIRSIYGVGFVWDAPASRDH